MNFSEQHSLRKPLSLILAAALTATLFTGCMKKDSATPEDTTSGVPGLNLSEATAPSETTSETTAPAAVVNENTATVTSQMNIRSSPSTEATVVGTLNAGDKVEIDRREEVLGVNWAYIISPEAGWIVMDYVEMDFPSQAPSGGDTNTPGATAPSGTGSGTTTGTEELNIKGVVTVNNLHIRSEASQDGKIQGSYNKGDIVTILETKNGWGRTNKGWVKMEYVNTSGTTTTTPTTGNDSSTTTGSSNVTGNGSTTVQFRGIVTAKELNIRASADQSADRVGSYTYGNRVEILEKSGSWGRTSKGWISLNYVYQDGTTGSKSAKGIVTADGLRIRSGPGTGYTSVGSYAEGDSVAILEQFTYDGVTWGCTNKGWISMKFVDTGSSDSDSSSDSSDSSNAQHGTVTAEGGLRIRKSAGDGEVVGSLKHGDRVTILSTTNVNGTTWGEISTGWISLDYVSLDD